MGTALRSYRWPPPGTADTQPSLLWRHSRPIWAPTYCRTCFSSEVELGELRSLPTSATAELCDLGCDGSCSHTQILIPASMPGKTPPRTATAPLTRPPLVTSPFLISLLSAPPSLELPWMQLPPPRSPAGTQPHADGCPTSTGALRSNVPHSRPKEEQSHQHPPPRTPHWGQEVPSMRAAVGMGCDGAQLEQL